MHSEFHCALTEQKMVEYKKQIEDGIKAESILADYNNVFISTCNESCPLSTESCKTKKDISIVFKIIPLCDHPYATSLKIVSVCFASNDIAGYTYHYYNLVNVVKSHICNN